MTRPSTVTRAGVLALMAQPHVSTMTQAEVGAAFGVTKEAAGNVLRALVASGHVAATKSKHLPTLYYALSAQAPAADDVVPSFKWDIWTKPLQGYDARMQAAMRMMSA